MTLSGSGRQFRGFLIQARLMSDDATHVGSFSNPPAGARLSSCSPSEVYTIICGSSFQCPLGAFTLQNQIGCSNHRVVTLVAYKLERQWLWEVYYNWKTIRVRQTLKQTAKFISQPQHMHQHPLWGNHLLALKTWKFLTATLNHICNDSFTHGVRVIRCCGWQEDGVAAFQVN